MAGNLGTRSISSRASNRLRNARKEFEIFLWVFGWIVFRAVRLERFFRFPSHLCQVFDVAGRDFADAVPVPPTECANAALATFLRYVIDASSFSLLMATATAWTIGVPVEKLRFRLIDIRDEGGLLIRLRIAFQDLAEVQEEILKEPVFRDFVQREKPGDSLLMYLAKSIVTISLSDRGTLWRALLLVQICVWKVRKEESEKGETVLFLERRPWLQAIRDYAARYGVTIVDLRPAINVPVLARRILTPKGVAAARTLRNYLYDLRFTLYRKEKDAQRDISPLPRRSASALANPERRKDPKVAVEYYGLLNLDQPEHYSNLFFWQQSALSGTDIVLTFAFPADPLDQKKWAELAAHGMDPFVLHPTAVNIPNAPVFMHWTN